MFQNDPNDPNGPDLETKIETLKNSIRRSEVSTTYNYQYNLIKKCLSYIFIIIEIVSRQLYFVHQENIHTQKLLH